MPLTRGQVENWWRDFCEIDEMYTFGDLIHPEDDRERTAFQPSDHCYNKSNIADIENGFPNHGKQLLFWYEGEATYRYVGTHAQVTGVIVWTDIHRQETVIGEWRNGRCEIYPRQQWQQIE